MYQYLFWALVGSILVGLWTLFLRGWEGRHNKDEDSFEPFKFGLLVVFAIPYLIVLIIVAIFAGIADECEKRFHKANKSP